MSLNPYVDQWLWEWNSSFGVDPDQGQPLRYTWTSIGAPTHFIGPDGLEINATLTEEHYFSRLYVGTDWALYNLYGEIRTRVNSWTVPAGEVDTGVHWVIDNGEKHIVIGFLQVDRASSDLHPEVNLHLSQAFLGVQTSGDGTQPEHWKYKVAFPWEETWTKIHIELNPNGYLSVYARNFGDFTDSDLILQVPYSDLPASTVRGIAFGKFTNGAANVQLHRMSWHPAALGRVQPAWIVNEFANKEFKIQEAGHDISRHPMSSGTGLAVIASYLDPLLTEQGWTVVGVYSGTSPDNTDAVLYKLNASQDYWLYFWSFGGLIKFLLYDYSYGLWPTLNLQAPPYGTHPIVTMSVATYQQSFLSVSPGGLFWFCYGEDAVTDTSAFILIETGESIYAAPSSDPPCFIFGDQGGVPVGYHHLNSGSWGEITPNQILDPGNIGNADSVSNILRVRHTQPMLIAYVAWNSLFKQAVSQNQIPSDSVNINFQVPFIWRNKFQLYQYSWASLSSINPGDQEVRFMPRHILASSEGLFGSLIIDEDQQIWIRPPLGPEGIVVPPTSHWVGGPFGKELEVHG